MKLEIELHRKQPEASSYAVGNMDCKSRFPIGNKNWLSYAVEKAPFSIQDFPIMFFNWTRQSRKLRFSIQHASRIHAYKNSENPAAYDYHTHTPQQHDMRHDPTPHWRRWLGCCHFCCCSPRVSVIHPYVRPSAARVSTRWPQCVVSMTFCRLLRWP